MTEKHTSPPLAHGFDLKRDLLASIVVFLVALPLCIGIALAVGVSPGRALITGIIGGIIVGALGGCPLQVCGPAAGLFVIVADAILKQRTIYASMKTGASEEETMAFALLALGVSVMLAGAMQFTAGQLKLGQWFLAVSPAVIEGMLGGIGILIFASQFHVMFDHDPLVHGHKAHGGLQYLQILPNAIKCCWEGSPLPSEKPVELKEGEKPAEVHGHAPAKPATIIPLTAGQHTKAAIIGITTILIIVLWGAYIPKQLKLIPGALVAILVAIAIVLVAGWQVNMLKVSGNIREDISFPSLDSLGLIFSNGAAIWSAVTSAMIIAIVASAETLLCATAVDQMHGGERTKYDKELTAHGFGNFLCGLVGALPMTGVIVRSSANVQAGATSRLSTILHGIWLLIFVVALPHLLAYIPKAALGAILVFTGYKLVKFKTLKELWKLDKGEAFIFLATITVVVVDDLLHGVLVGLSLSALKLLHRFSHLQPSLTIESGNKKAVLRLEGAATFIRLPILASFLDQVPAGAELHVDFSQLSYIDHACLELMTSWAKRHSSTGGRLVIDWESLHARFHDNGAKAAAKRSITEGKVLV